MHFIVEKLDADGDGWPEGLGNVERTGMGEEKLDNTVYTIRGLTDLADMAAARGDRATERWAQRHARDLERRFEAAWWLENVPGYADSLDDPGNNPLYQRFWIGVTPMEAELTGDDGQAEPGLARHDRAVRSLAVRQQPCYGDDFGMYHTGAAGCDGSTEQRPTEKQTFTLNTAIMAVGEGNYGRLGPDQQQRFTTANRRLQLPDPDEQPGAMPEIAPSPLVRALGRQAVHRARLACSRRGARTGRPGRSSTSSSACGRTSAAAGSRSCRSRRRAAPIAGSDIRLGSRAASTSRPQHAAGRARRRSRRTRRSALRIGATLPAGAQRRPACAWTGAR